MTTMDGTRTERIREASQERRERRKAELRQEILTAAGIEFLEHGYAEFSLRRVAERIGYSPTTIYLHFANKDELLLATVQHGFANFDAVILAAGEGAPDPLTRMEALGRAYIRFGLDNPEFYRLMFMQRADFFLMPRLLGIGSPENARDELGDTPHHHVLAQEMLCDAVREAIALGEIGDGDPLMIADALWAGAHGLVALAISPLMDRAHAERVSDQLLRTLIEGLRVPAS